MDVCTYVRMYVCMYVCVAVRSLGFVSRMRLLRSAEAEGISESACDPPAQVLKEREILYPSSLIHALKRTLLYVSLSLASPATINLQQFSGRCYKSSETISKIIFFILIFQQARFEPSDLDVLRARQPKMSQGRWVRFPVSTEKHV